MKKLQICITSHNRPTEAFNLMLRLHAELMNLGIYEDEVGIQLFIDGGGSRHDEYVKHLDLIYSNPRFNIIESIDNLGAFRAKYQNILEASEVAEWVLHCDDDDWVSIIFIKNFLTWFNSESRDYDMIQGDCMRFGNKFKGITSRFAIQDKYNRNALCLNGLIMKSEAIRPNLDTYPDCYLNTLTNKRDVWGDDVLIASYLSQGIDENRIKIDRAYLSTQVYLDDDYHLCHDKEVKKMTSAEKKPFVRNIKLRK